MIPPELIAYTAIVIGILIMLAVMPPRSDHQHEIERLRRELEDQKRKHGPTKELSRRLVNLRAEQLRSE